MLITLGEKGACFCTEASRKLTFVAAEKVTVEDTTVRLCLGLPTGVSISFRTDEAEKAALVYTVVAR